MLTSPAILAGQLPDHLTLKGTVTSYTFGAGEVQMGSAQMFLSEIRTNTLWSIIGRSDSNNVTDHDLQNDVHGKMCTSDDQITSISSTYVGCERNFTQVVNIVKYRPTSFRSPVCISRGPFANYTGIINVTGSIVDPTIPGCNEAIPFNKVTLEGKIYRN
jgi:hypothetical protein